MECNFSQSFSFFSARIMRIIKNNESDNFNVSDSQRISSYSNIPVAMLLHGWKVNSAILLGSKSAHHDLVPCAKCVCCVACMNLKQCCQRFLCILQLKVMDCCPPPEWTLLMLIFSLIILQGYRQNDQWTLKVCTKWFPKISRYRQRKIQCCIFNLDYGMTVLPVH